MRRTRVLVPSGASWRWRILAVALALDAPTSVTCKQVVIAAVGDFLTVGKDPNNPSGYPGILAMRLSGAAQVINFGEMKATMREGGIVSYSNSEPYQSLLKSNPDIVTFMLGTNDAKHGFWDEVAFKKGAKSLIMDCLSLASRPRVLVFQPPPLYRDGVQSLRQKVVNDHERSALPQAVASTESSGSVEYSMAVWNAMGGAALRCKECYFAEGEINDGIHPTSIGFKKMAAAVFDSLMAQDALASALVGNNKEPRGNKSVTEISTADQIRANTQVIGAGSNLMQPLPAEELPTTTTQPEPVNTPESDDFELTGALEKEAPIPQGLPTDVVQTIVNARTKESLGKDAPPPRNVKGDAQSRQVETPENGNLKEIDSQSAQAGQSTQVDQSKQINKEQTDSSWRRQSDQPQEVLPGKRKKRLLEPDAVQSKRGEQPFASALTRIVPPIGAALLPCSAAAYIIFQAVAKRGFSRVPQMRH